MIIANLYRVQSDLSICPEDLPAPEPREILMLGYMQGSDFDLFWC